MWNLYVIFFITYVSLTLLNLWAYCLGSNSPYCRVNWHGKIYCLNIIHILLKYLIDFILTGVCKKHEETLHQKEPQKRRWLKLQEGEDQAQLLQQVSVNKWRMDHAPEPHFQMHCLAGAAKEWHKSHSKTTLGN